jgi:hypothetical protein
MYSTPMLPQWVAKHRILDLIEWHNGSIRLYMKEGILALSFQVNMVTLVKWYKWSYVFQRYVRTRNTVLRRAPQGYRMEVGGCGCSID